MMVPHDIISHVLALAVKHVDPKSSAAATAKSEQVSVSVPFKAMGRPRAAILKVSIALR